MSSPLTGVSPLLCVCYSNGLFAEVAGARRGDRVQTIYDTHTHFYVVLCAFSSGIRIRSKISLWLITSTATKRGMKNNGGRDTKASGHVCAHDDN